MEALLFLLAIAAVGLIGWLVHRHRQKVEAAWRKAASGLGLAYSSGGTFGKREIRGELDGHQVLVDRYTRSTGKSSKTFTRYRITYPSPLGVGLKLKREGVLYGVARFLGAQDIQVGDAAFDDGVVVKGSDPRQVVEFLTPSRRLRILRLLNALDGCEINDTGIQWSKPGSETDPGRLVDTVRRIVRLGSDLSGPAAEEVPLDRAMHAAREGRLGEALDLVRAGPDPESRLVEGQILYAGGRYEEAAEAFRQGSVAAPGDEELGAWSSRAAAKLAAAGAAPGPVGAAPAPPRAGEPAPPQGKRPEPGGDDADAAPAGPGAERVCEELFDPGILSLEATRLFEERYQNQRVRWTGVLRRAEPYSFDLVFGDRPGTKLVLDLHEVAGGVFARRVRAVVQLPPEALEAVGGREGRPVRFEGRLAACDAFLRSLFIADGRVIGDAAPGSPPDGDAATPGRDPE